MIKTLKKYITGEVLDELFDFSINTFENSHEKISKQSNKNVYCSKEACITTEGDCY